MTVANATCPATTGLKPSKILYAPKLHYLYLDSFINICSNHQLHDKFYVNINLANKKAVFGFFANEKSTFMYM